MIDVSYWCTPTLILLAVVFLVIQLKRHSPFGYFSKRKIPYEKPVGLLGSRNASSLSMPYLLWDLYENSGPNKLLGFFVAWKPAILVKDLDLIKDILVKNFSSFVDRGVYFDEEKDPLTANLFALEGDVWRKLRTKLSPAFTSGKMKLMFPTIAKYADALVEYIDKKSSTDSLECFALMAKFTLSNIASTAFGIESNIFEEDSKFMKVSLSINEPSVEQQIKTFLVFQLRGLAKFLSFKAIPTDITSFYLSLVKDAVSYRETNNITRKDILQMLIELKNKGFIEDSKSEDKNPLTMKQISAQAFVFLVAGFETSALAMNWALYELALNPDVQTRLQSEIDAFDDWTYQKIMTLEYLDMVLNETLRKYPSVPFLVRKCAQDFQVPDSDVIIEKGSDVNISVFGLHRDPELFPLPDKFDPERFGPDPPHEVKPYSYLPFGEGPRFCIGMRFAKMQSKVGLATLMRHFTVEPSEKTQIPAQLHRKTFQTNSKDGIFLRFKRRIKH